MASTRPTDFSPASTAAFRAAVDAAHTQRAELIVAHAVALPFVTSENGPTSVRRSKEPTMITRRVKELPDRAEFCTAAA